MPNSDLKKCCRPHSSSNLVETTKTQMAAVGYRRVFIKLYLNDTQVQLHILIQALLIHKMYRCLCIRRLTV